MQSHFLGQPLLLLLNVAVTAIFAGFSGVALASSSVEAGYVLFCLLLFVVGALALFVALLKAISRSRFAEVSLAGVFFLAHGSTPKKVRTSFLALLALQVMVGFVVALAAPSSATVFAVLVFQMGFGLMALQGAFLGRFAAK